MRYTHVVFAASSLLVHDAPAPRPFDGVGQMLDALAQDGVSLGLLACEADGPELRALDQLGLLAPFGAVMAAFERERTGANPAETLLVGCSADDATRAENAGVDFALACWGQPPVRRHVRATAYAMSPWHVVELVRRERRLAEREPWLAWVRELQAIAQAGLYYGRDPFDVERFGRIREMATEALGSLSGLPLPQLESLFASEDGYQTPKLDTRSVIFDDAGRICLVNERQGGWALPGGWLDQGQTVFSNAVKEAREEAGLEVVPVRVIALQEHNLHNEHPFAWGILKVFVICEPIAGEFEDNIETIERGFFSRESLPEPLLAAKTTREQVEMCFAAYDADDAWQLVVD